MQDLTPSSQARQIARKTFTWLLAITAFAFCLRLGVTVAFVGLWSPPDLSASPDQAEYDAILQQLVAGNGYAKEDGSPTARRAAGMVFTALPIYALTDGSYAATRLLFITLSALTCLIVGLTVAKVFNDRAGLIAAGLLAVLPGHFYYPMHLLSEAPFGFWLSLAILLTVVAMHRQQRWWPVYMVAGLCWGAAVLTKPQFVLLAPLVVLAACIYAFRNVSWRPVLAGAVCVLAASAVVMPWYVRNAVVLDAPGLSTIGGYGIWAGNNELVLDDPDWRGRAIPTSEIERRLGVKLPEGEAASDAQAKAYGLAFIKSHMAEMPELTLWKAYRLVTPFQHTENRAAYWAHALAWIMLAPMLTVGIVLAMRQRRTEALVWLGPILVTIGVTLVFFAIIRYRDTLLPCMVPFAAIAVDWAWSKLVGRKGSDIAGSIEPSDASPQPSRIAA